MRVVEDIPSDLRDAAGAALDWINRERGTDFRLTGLVDPETAAGLATREPVELGLVLCSGDVCRREQVRIAPRAGGFDVSEVEAGPTSVPAHLDPPPGNRKDWVDRQLDRYRFVLLLYYRGLW